MLFVKVNNPLIAGPWHFLGPVPKRKCFMPMFFSVVHRKFCVILPIKPIVVWKEGIFPGPIKKSCELLSNFFLEFRKNGRFF